jgi:hypothetical protein
MLAISPLLTTPRTAHASGGPNTITAPTLPSGTPVNLTACPGSLSQSGNYTLNQDLTQASGTSPCILLTNVDGISLDCQDHTIFPAAGSPPPVSLSSVSNFALKNCHLPGSTLGINNASRGLVDHVTMSTPPGNGGTLTVGDSNNLTITNNTLDHSPYHQINSSFVEFSTNSVTADPTVRSASLSGAVELDGGTNNNLVNNTIDGSWSTSTPDGYAADDGIMLVGRSGDYISHNTIRNAWDAGIETEGMTSGEQLLDNTITNIRLYGIGAWFQNSWLGNTVSGNTISQTGQLLEFYLDTSRTLNPAYMPSTYYFKDNQFVGNTFASGTSASTGREAAVINYGSQFLPPGVTPVLGNNLFQTNNFGTFQTGPHLDPPTMITDGGSNTCAPNPNYPNPLSCTHVAAAPVASLSATPNPVPYGSSTTLTWSTTNNPTSCDGNFPITTAASGSWTTPPLTSGDIYWYNCTNGTQGRSATVTVDVSAPPPAPTDSIAASPAQVAYNTSTTISWSATNNPTSCTGNFPGSSTPSGTYTTPPLTTPTTYWFRCTNAGGTGNTASVTVGVDPPPDTTAPTVSITAPANNATVTRGNTVTVSLTASDNVGVTQVDLYANGIYQCTATTSPYSCSFRVSSTRNVAYSLQAKAKDAAGNVGTSSTIHITTR